MGVSSPPHSRHLFFENASWQLNDARSPVVVVLQSIFFAPPVKNWPLTTGEKEWGVDG